jgi:2-oxoglutarate/2-oxoacid ferredoxin oxidoreductase subunit alpha
MIGQMMEPVEFKEITPREIPKKNWATEGTKGKRKPNIINSLSLDPSLLEEHNIKLDKKYQEMVANEVRVEVFNMESAEVVLSAYGTTARVAKNAIELLDAEGIKAGLIRPITLWPFPHQVFREIPETAKAILTVEMSMGQMVDDVKIANEGRLPVHFYGRSGGMCPEPQAIVDKVKEILGGVK